MRTLFSLFQISDRNRDNVKSYKESCQLAFAKRIRHVSKEMAKIILLMTIKVSNFQCTLDLFSHVVIYIFSDCHRCRFSVLLQQSIIYNNSDSRQRRQERR